MKKRVIDAGVGDTPGAFESRCRKYDDFRANMPEVIVIIGALVLLTPASILYLFGMPLALMLGFLYLFFGHSGFSSIMYFFIAGILIFPGYGLFALWWLVFKFSTVTFSKIPFFIHAGLIAGAISSLLIFSPVGPFVIPDSSSYAMVGGGPLVLLLMIILLLRIKGRNEGP